ncbi:Metallo-dependent phosphatase [Aulographum hederae CBS 113979]|uniref:Metallo-dependent phosphatase n=1 Tax=Aulographum hederae CBS 113979 TaxID=1176131 RepID=A0A6G1GXK1_9PEZI|nr:Metallo-dependent phosphatase [Aulographum hederae CBS 113979]
MTDKPRNVKLPGQRQAKWAGKLIKLHPLHREEEGSTTSASLPSGTGQPPVKIVCISDTHGSEPPLPEGDVLIHAGDLTENGSFDEIQAQLTWLSSQPHRHKLVIAGNHDVLLDPDFLSRHPERRYGDSRTADDLEWGSVKYLQDAAITLTFPKPADADSSNSMPRKLKIFGSPHTPLYGTSAFQYPRSENIWPSIIPADDIDILVTHGPPRLYLDSAGAQKAGCAFLTREVARLRPRLMVFGHIHAGYGQLDVVVDRARGVYDEILNRETGWWGVLSLGFWVGVAWMRAMVLGREGLRGRERVTTFVNAAVVGGRGNEVVNGAVVVVV